MKEAPWKPKPLSTHQHWQNSLEGDYESYEFVEGKLIPMAAAKIIHGDIAAEVLMLLGSYVKEHQLGKLYTRQRQCLQ